MKSKNSSDDKVDAIKNKKKKNRLLINHNGLVKINKKQVDFKDGEIAVAKRPMPRKGLKRKVTPTGKLSLQFERPENYKSDHVPKITLISVHRAYKIDKPHLELKSYCDKQFNKSLNDIHKGHYCIVFQLKGYRPLVHFIKYRGKDKTLKLPTVLSPVSSQREEEELIRVNEKHPHLLNVRAFLKRFGYLKASACKCEGVELCEHLSSALRLFQETNELASRGSLTIDSFVLMQKPRCGHPDFPIEDTPEESTAGPAGTTKMDPIVYMGNRWDTYDLKYKLFTGTSDISNEWSIIRNSMATWADVSPLIFTETSSSSQSHIEFDFRRPNESDYPFDKGGDKDGNILAHAWGPTDGLVEFDDHENWGSTHLDAVSTHEIGHALGLDHSSVKQATMYAWYDGGQASLHEVDVRGIKSLYPPIYRSNADFVSYPLYAFKSKKGTDTVIIDLGSTKHFLAWGTATMVDSLSNFDRDNMYFFDIYEVDGNRTGWFVSGGEHFGSSNSPGNVYQGAYVGYGQKISFRLTAGHNADLEAAGYAIVMVLN